MQRPVGERASIDCGRWWIRPLWIGLFVVTAAGPVPGAIKLSTPPDDEITAADVTSRERNWHRVIRRVLSPQAQPTDEEQQEADRWIVFLVDPTDSVVRSPFATMLGTQCMAGESLPAQIAVARVGEVRDKGLSFLEKPQDVVDRLLDLENYVDPRFHDLCSELGHVARNLERRDGVREVVVVSFDNVDLENNLERTVDLLQRRDIRCSWITREAPLSDSYWLWRRLPEGGGPPRDTILYGADGPFVDVPFSWLFQRSPANEATPSGFGPYLCSRLAAGTGGTVYLPRQGSGDSHRCVPAGGCVLCGSDHRPQGEAYLPTKLKALAPLAESRREAGHALATDPRFQAVVMAWEEAARSRLIRFGPPFEVRGGAVRPARPTEAGELLFASDHSFDTTQSISRRAVKDCERIRRTLEGALKRTANRDGSQRVLAIADYVRFMLELTRFNLRALDEWCDEAGEIQAGKRRKRYEEPEIPPFEDGEIFRGIRWSMLPTCHGIDALRELHLPGGDRLAKDFDRLDEIQREMRQKYAFSPYLRLTHLSQAALFVSSMGHLQGRPNPRGSISSGDTRPLTPRPVRATGGSAQAGGASTGGDG